MRCCSRWAERRTAGAPPPRLPTRTQQCAPGGGWGPRHLRAPGAAGNRRPCQPQAHPVGEAAALARQCLRAAQQCRLPLPPPPLLRTRQPRPPDAANPIAKCQEGLGSEARRGRVGSFPPTCARGALWRNHEHSAVEPCSRTPRLAGPFRRPTTGQRGPRGAWSGKVRLGTQRCAQGRTPPRGPTRQARAGGPARCAWHPVRRQGGSACSRPAPGRSPLAVGRTGTCSSSILAGIAFAGYEFSLRFSRCRREPFSSKMVRGAGNQCCPHRRRCPLRATPPPHRHPAPAAAAPQPPRMALARAPRVLLALAAIAAALTGSSARVISPRTGRDLLQQRCAESVGWRGVLQPACPCGGRAVMRPGERPGLAAAAPVAGG